MNRIREKTKWSLQVYQNAKQIEDLDILLKISSTWITAIGMDGHDFNFFLFIYFKLPDPKIKTEHVQAESKIE